MKTVQFTHIEIFITKLYYINTFQAAVTVSPVTSHVMQAAVTRDVTCVAYLL